MKISPIDVSRSQAKERKLLPHQEEALAALDGYFVLGQKAPQKGLLVMPTGSGKNFTAVTWLLDRAVPNGYMVLWLTHRQELVGEAYRMFVDLSPILSRHGIKKLRIIPISDQHDKMSHAFRHDVNICSVDTAAGRNGQKYLSRMLGRAGKDKLVVVIEEAHHAVSPSYERVLKSVAELSPNRILLGLTATPKRMQAAEYKKLRSLFDVSANLQAGRGNENGYIYEVGYNRLMLEGYLARPVCKRVDTQIAGDEAFDIADEDVRHFERWGELSEAVKEQLAKSAQRNEIIANEYVNNAAKYGKTLVFAVNQLHCKTLYKAFTRAGVSCNYCIAGEPGAASVIRDFKAGVFDVLINVLTEGVGIDDIQSIFLTGQTNSDSLLMQMVGRGLRGVGAGGTEYAYIVDFRDRWNRFSFWVSPTALDFDPEIETARTADGEAQRQELRLPSQSEGFGSWEVLARIHSALRNGAKGDAFPCGWYAVLDEDGQDRKVLVYDDQRPGYEAIAQNAATIAANGLNADDCLRRYFDISENLPSAAELQLVLKALIETGEMPEYFAFEMRDRVDARAIAAQFRGMDRSSAGMEYRLEKTFERTPMLRELYGDYAAFRQRILDELDSPRVGEAEVLRIGESDFGIMSGHYDLAALLGEAVAENRALNANLRPAIRWTHRPMKRYFARCRRFDDGSLDILVSCLLSTPQVPRAVVKYVVFRQLLIANGMEGEAWNYPDADRHDAFLQSLAARFKVEDDIWGVNSEAGMSRAQ